jgi:hypothetical protein
MVERSGAGRAEGLPVAQNNPATYEDPTGLYKDQNGVSCGQPGAPACNTTTTTTTTATAASGQGCVASRYSGSCASVFAQYSGGLPSFLGGIGYSFMALLDLLSGPPNPAIMCGHLSVCGPQPAYQSPTSEYMGWMHHLGVQTGPGSQFGAGIGTGATITMLLGLAAGPGDAAALAPEPGSLDVVGSGFSSSEKSVAQFLSSQGRNVVLREATGVGRTSDMLVNGVPYDTYTPEFGTSVRNILSEAASKWTQVRGGGVVIDLSNTGLQASDFGNALARVNGFINSWGGTPMSEVMFYGGG